MNSKGHCARASEMAAADEQIGECLSLRRFEPNNVGYRARVLNKQGFIKFWGSEVYNMPQIIYDRLQNGCVIKVDVTSKYKLRLTLKDIVHGGGLGFGAASYPGQGKYGGGGQYDETKEYFVRWQDMRDDDDADEEPTPTGTPNSGWWPVRMVSWVGEAECFGYAPDVYTRAQCAGIVCVWVLRWYQLQDGDYELQAWPIWLAPWSRL